MPRDKIKFRPKRLRYLVGFDAKHANVSSFHSFQRSPRATLARATFFARPMLMSINSFRFGSNRWHCGSMLAACCVVFLGIPLGVVKRTVAEVPRSPSKISAEFFSEHCFACHDSNDPASGLDLTQLSDSLEEANVLDRWVRVLDRVVAGEMPPESETPPLTESRHDFTQDLAARLTDFDQRRQQANGRTNTRRLNRYEYERTVQDLLKISTPLAVLLPRETPMSGFDTVADGLRFSPLHLESYLEAANVALDEAINLSVEPTWVNERFDYRKEENILNNLGEEKSIVRLLDDGVAVFSDAAYITRLRGLHIETAGRYRIRVRGRGFQTERPVILSLHAGNWNKGSTRLLTFEDVFPDRATEIEVVARLENNEYLYPAPKDLNVDPEGKGVWHAGGKAYEYEGVAIEWIEVEGPLVESWPPPSIRAVFGDIEVRKLEQSKWQSSRTIGFELHPTDPKRDAERVIRQFAKRAFRRPVADDDVDLFVELAHTAIDDGSEFESAVRIGLRAILTSPRFLTLTEPVGELDDHALAARLSYFLWSTAPDDELLRLAEEGNLSQAVVLREQTERLLSDPRSAAFVERFTDQWLDLQRIDATSPDARLYPEFTEILQRSMMAETRAFVGELLAGDDSLLNIIDSDFSMLNRTLADHYGITDVEGQSMQRVPLPEHSRRGGVLTQASVLKVTANGTVTSPVVRGSFVLSRLLDQPPSPPPPGVGSIEPDTRGATTVRDQLALHRSDMSCARCHNAIDPPGFALESFDAIGGLRSRYRSTGDGDSVTDRKLSGRNIWEYKYGLPVTTNGITSDGQTFDDIDGFRTWLMNQPDKIATSLTKQLVTYATGAGISIGDRDAIDQIVDRTSTKQYGLRTLVHEIIQSRLFLHK